MMLEKVRQFEGKQEHMQGMFHTTKSFAGTS